MRTTIPVAVAVALVAAIALGLALLPAGEEPAPVAGADAAAGGATPAVGGGERAASGQAPATAMARREEPEAASDATDRGGEASFDIVRVAPDGAAVIAGRTYPGAKVTVRAGDKVIGEVVADHRGEWALVPEQALDSGAVELSQRVEAPGRESFDSEQVVVVVVPERPGPGSDEQVLVLRTPRAGGASILLQGPKAEGGGGKGLALSAVDYDEDGNLVLSGEAGGEATVRAYIDDTIVGTARADAEGDWRLTPEAPVAEGVHRLRIDQIDDGGKVVMRIEMPFSRVDLDTLAPAAGHVVVQPGNSLWRIARRVYGRGIRYTVIYQANRDHIRDADLIYPGQVFALPEVD